MSKGILGRANSCMVQRLKQYGVPWTLQHCSSVKCKGAGSWETELALEVKQATGLERTGRACEERLQLWE